MNKDIIIKEFEKIIKENDGIIPRGSIAQVARKCKSTYQVTNTIYKNKYKFGEVKKNYASGKSIGVMYGPIHKEDLSTGAMISKLHRLEGAIQGIMPFHPKLAQYMMDQLNTLYRYFNISNEIKEITLPTHEKEYWKEVDRQILHNDIIDNKATKGL